MTSAPDRSSRGLYHPGGISALAIGIAYAVIIILFIRIGAPPAALEPRLAYLAANQNTWWAILILSVLTDLLFLPVTIALYAALSGINRNLMIFAAAGVLLFIVLDLAITWTNYAALLALSRHYADAATPSRKSLAMAAAAYSSAILDSKLLFVYNSLTLAAGIFLAGLVMIRSRFGAGTAYLGIATGLSGFVSVLGSFWLSALGTGIVLTSLLTACWLLLVGAKLVRFGRGISSSGRSDETTTSVEDRA